MDDERPGVIVDLGVESAVCEMHRALADEGLQVIARIDHVWRDCRNESRPCILIEAWSAERRQEALRQHAPPPDAFLVTTFTIYELAEGRTAVVVSDPLPEQSESQADPALAALACEERERAERVLDRVRHRGTHGCA